MTSAPVRLSRSVDTARDPANRASPVPSSSGPLARLQAAAGNRAVTALLQRQPVVAPKKLLSPAQAARAVSFYRSQPDLYPPDVVKKIQKAVKSPETGVADTDMAEGVATFQNESVLKVDGMAGPRTLPRLFESGLATKSSREKFVAVGKAVKDSWVKLGTPEARAAKLYEGVKPLLAAEKVPAPSHDVVSLGKAAGVFYPTPWHISFDRTALSQATITDDAARSISATVYHEARHAEQRHKMARMRRARGRTAQQIQDEMKIPIAIAKDAFDNPLPRGVEFATASQQYDSVYGAGRAHHKKAEDEAPSHAELKAAEKEAKDNPTAANKAKYARLVAAYKAYHDLPTEHDAFATEQDFELSWDEASAVP